MSDLSSYCRLLNKSCCGAYCGQASSIADSILLVLSTLFDKITLHDRTDTKDYIRKLFKHINSLTDENVNVDGITNSDNTIHFINDGKRGMIRVSFKDFQSASVNKMITILLQVPNLDASPFDISTVELKANKIEDMGEYLEPYNIEKLTAGDLKQHIIRRAQIETVIGHFLSLSTSLFVCCAATDFIASPILSNLKFYLEHCKYKKSDGTEELAEIGLMDGRTRMMSVYERDILAPQRVLCAINTHILFMSQLELDLGLSELMIEAFHFIFKSPYVNTKKYKGLLSNTLNMCFALSVTGECPKWTSSGLYPGSHLCDVSIQNIKDMHPRNDAVSYAIVSNAIKEDLAEMQILGLKHTKQWAEAIVRSPVVARAFRQISHVRALFAMAGYTKTFVPISHENQVKAERKLDQDDRIDKYKQACNIEGYPWDEKLAALTERMIDFGIRYKNENGGFMNAEEWLKKIPFLLTSSSPGVREGDLPVSESNKISVRLPGRNTRGEPNELTFVCKSRAGRFIVDPFADINMNNVIDTYSSERAGKTGTRFVVAGKPARMIIPSHNMLYFLQNIFYTPLITYALHANQDKYLNFYCAANFHYGYDTGVLLLDNPAYLQACTDGRFLLFISDFSTLDATLNDKNFRSRVRSAIISYIKKRGFDGPWGNNSVKVVFKGGLPEILNSIWGKGTSYDVHMISSEAGVKKEFTLDMVLSGELDTSILDSMATHSNFESFMDFMQGQPLSKKLLLECFNILGDDFISIFHDDAQMSKDEIKDFCNLYQKFSTYNDLKVKSGSSIMRRFAYEYLKKWHFYGIYAPLMHMQFFASERVEDSVDPIERLSAYRSVCALFAERGLSHRIATNVLTHTWNVHRGIKSPGQLDGDKCTIWYYLPFITLYIPISSGGIGTFPGTCMGANNDGSIAMEYTFNENMQRDILRCIDILQFSKSAVMQDIAKKIVAGEVTTPKHPFEKGQNYIRTYVMDSDVLKQSEVSIKWLEERNMPSPGFMSYKYLPDRVAETVVTGIKDVRLAVDYIKSEQVKKHIINALHIKKGNYLDKFKWVNFVTYKMEEMKYDNVDHTNYFESSDPLLSKLSCIMGPALKVNLTANTIKAISTMIMRDINLPRDVRVEFIVDYLSNPKFSQVEAFMNAGQALGLTNATCTSLFTMINGFERRVELSVLTDLISWNDSFFPNLDLSEENIERFIKYNDISFDTKSLYYKSGMLYIMLKYLQTGKLYHLDIMNDDNTRLLFNNYTYHEFIPVVSNGLPRIFGKFKTHYEYGHVLECEAE